MSLPNPRASTGHRILHAADRKIINGPLRSAHSANGDAEHTTRGAPLAPVFCHPSAISMHSKADRGAEPRHRLDHSADGNASPDCAVGVHTHALGAGSRDAGRRVVWSSWARVHASLRCGKFGSCRDLDARRRGMCNGTLVVLALYREPRAASFLLPRTFPTLFPVLHLDRVKIQRLRPECPDVQK